MLISFVVYWIGLIPISHYSKLNAHLARNFLPRHSWHQLGNDVEDLIASL